MALKSLTQNDQSAVAKLLTAYWAERGLGEYGQEWAEAYLVEGHKKEIAADEFFVYEENGEIIGVIALVTDVSNIAQIRDMVIKPEYRKKGIGKKMIQALLEKAKERKIRKIFAFVLPHPQTVNAATELGFEKEGVLKSHFAEGEDLTIFSKFL